MRSLLLHTRSDLTQLRSTPLHGTARHRAARGVRSRRGARRVGSQTLLSARHRDIPRVRVRSVWRVSALRSLLCRRSPRARPPCPRRVRRASRLRVLCIYRLPSHWHSAHVYDSYVRSRLAWLNWRSSSELGVKYLNMNLNYRVRNLRTPRLGLQSRAPRLGCADCALWPGSLHSSGAVGAGGEGRSYTYTFLHKYI